MKKRHIYLLSIISDGKLHSGEMLAAQLNISRAAIWKLIKQLELLGLQINATLGKGYRLSKPLELLSAEKIKERLPSENKKYCNKIEVLFKTNSTNSYLFNRLTDKKIHGDIVLAEFQTDGRGRRGHKWVAPLGSGLNMSIGWRFEIAPNTLSLLSLYMGVAITRVLQSENINGVGLKWPNDVIVKNKKIAGILLEICGKANGSADVVIGIGINYDLTEEIKTNIKQPVTDICSHTGKRLSRNTLAAKLLSKVFEILEGLNKDQNLNLLDEWRALDCYAGQSAELILPNKKIEGVLKGVDAQGSLLISVAGRVESYTAGEISLSATR